MQFNKEILVGVVRDIDTDPEYCCIRGTFDIPGYSHLVTFNILSRDMNLFKSGDVCIGVVYTYLNNPQVNWLLKCDKYPPGTQLVPKGYVYVRHSKQTFDKVYVKMIDGKPSLNTYTDDHLETFELVTEDDTVNRIAKD